ncbi:hypothetical protein GTS_49700 [Gandjariella thermophila]|uniref:Uncharacterized protein n=1 Tax=Gandjariella thermophila TaxID=1931992 RepID=A0A4D4JHH0_9PSEU|nr:hypothetical protein GTS_49700 [Gandjariella thermophila]
MRPAAGTLAGALMGCVALLVATFTFYGINLLLKGSFWWGQVYFWWARSLALGAPLGAVGATIRRPGLGGVLAALVVPVGAALNVIVLPPPADSLMAKPVLLTVWGAATTAAVLIVARAIRARRSR